MGRNPRHFLERNGRYFARLTVPAPLRPYLDGKRELRKPLGPDRRMALRKHPIAVAELMQKITAAERRAAEAQGIPETPGRYPLSDAQIALRNYIDRLQQDARARTELPAYASMGIDDRYVATLRAGMAGLATNAELEELVGHRIEHFRKIGNTTVEHGTPAWRGLAMTLCISEYEALSRLVERDEGDLTGTPVHPMLRDGVLAHDEEPPIPLRHLFEDYLDHLATLGRSPRTIRNWRAVYDNLRRFLRHDDARRITRQNMIAWRDEIATTRSAKTVSETYLGAVRAAFNWAVSEDRIAENPVDKVRQRAAKEVRSRSKGYTDLEAQTILSYSRAHAPAVEHGRVREAPSTTAARRWGPILAAHTGARITEIMQLRKSDLRQEDGIHVLRLSPEAGTIKTGHYRDVPLHPQLVELGFPEFVAEAPDGALFYIAKADEVRLDKAEHQGNRIAAWLRKANLVPSGVQPNHAWRHRFKTVAREVGISDRVADAICGHAGRTAGDNYGDVSIKARARAICQMPPDELDG
ncbi:tyrosine-type recombinase/integrase [Roseivivax sp. CAU 1761]